MADGLRGTIVLSAHVRKIASNRNRVSITMAERGTQTLAHADYAILAIPATTLRDVEFSPALPQEQQTAIRTLPYGPATRLLLQFERPYWRRRHRQRAFGTPFSIGAVWDASEHQRGRAGILMTLAGGRASAECRATIANEGIDGLLAQLRWLGPPAPVLTMWHTSWEDDPLSRGGYAVFGPQFDPWLRDWLRRPAGRIAFAGEHTSLKWEGFMNGAIESGLRAAAEIRARSMVNSSEW
jgi:monoamine oxidase